MIMASILNIDGTNYNQYFTQTLDSEEYILHVYYNRRSGWYISFYDSDLFDEEETDNSDALIYGGRKLMPNQDVLGRVVDEDNLPQGALYCVDTDIRDTSEQETVTKGTFGSGNRYNLVYFTEEEKSENDL